MIYVSFSSLQIDNISCIIAATIFLRWKMLIYIFAKLWSKTWIALLTITIFFIKRKNVLWWKISCWLTVWSTMSIISLKSSFSSDEISMKFNHSSFINEFKHSLTSMKSFSSLSIVNLASFLSLFHSSKSRTSLHWLITFCHDSSLVRLSLLVLSDLFSLRHLN